MGEIQVVLFSNNEDGKIVTIDDSLKSMQKTVGGYIQAVPLPNYLYLICNEEGSFDGSPYQERYGMYGDFFVCGAGSEGDFGSLSNHDAEWVAEKIDLLLTRVNRR